VFVAIGVRFRIYMNVPIAFAQNHGGSPEPCDIAQVPLVVTPFDEGEYGTEEMIRMSRLLQSSFICPATSSFTLSNITVLTFSSTMERRNHATTVSMSSNLLPTQDLLANTNVAFGIVLL